MCVFVLQARSNTFSISSQIFICCLNYYIFDEQIVLYDFLSKLLSYVILFCCIAKANYSGEDAVYSPCHTISQQSPFNVSGGQSQQRLVFSARIIPFGIREATNLALCIVSLGTFHSAVSIFTLTLRTHILTTVHIT